MEFTFVKFKYLNKYVSMVDPHNKSRILTFKTKPLAKYSINKISEFRSEYGVWPELNLTQDMHNCRSKKQLKKRTPLEISEFFEIDTMNQEELLYFLESYRVELFYCHEFDLIKKNGFTSTLSIRGQEIDLNPETDEAFRKRLELTLKYK